MDRQERSRLRKSIEKMEPGDFYFSDLYGPRWDTLYIGDKVRLGRDFLNAVRGGDFPGVEDTGRKRDGGRLYHLSA